MLTQKTRLSIILPIAAAIGLAAAPIFATTEYYTNQNNNSVTTLSEKSQKNCSAATKNTYHSPFRPYQINYIIPFYYTGSPAPESEIIKSEPNKKPCGVYHVETSSITFIISNCEDTATVEIK